MHMKTVNSPQGSFKLLFNYEHIIRPIGASHTHMTEVVNNNASATTTTIILIAVPHIFVMGYCPGFRGDGITGDALSVCFQEPAS